MENRVAVVGDVHGSSSSLSAVVEWLEGAWEHDVVFVGDYVNRGSDTRGVLATLVRLQDKLGDRLTLLQGNHDATLLRFLEGDSPARFLAHGGLLTIRNYLRENISADPFEQFKRAFPDSHLRLLRSLKAAYETADLLVTHAGFNPSNPESRDAEDVVFGRFPQLFESGLKTPRPLVICGHYVQRSLKPYCSSNFICLDTGCGSVPGAPLSVALLPKREFKIFSGER